MLTIVLPASNGEVFDEQTNEFLFYPEVILKLEHSLVSISKWESKFHKAYIDPLNEQRSMEETIYYIECMTLNPEEVPDGSYRRLTQNDIFTIQEYMNDPMTATVISKMGDSSRKPAKKITNEEIYQLMIANNIPVEFEEWHINRLMTLIEVCQIKGQPQKKMGKNEALEYQRKLNAQRRKKH